MLKIEKPIKPVLQRCHLCKYMCAPGCVCIVITQFGVFAGPWPFFGQLFAVSEGDIRVLIISGRHSNIEDKLYIIWGVAQVSCQRAGALQSRSLGLKSLPAPLTEQREKCRVHSHKCMAIADSHYKNLSESLIFKALKCCLITPGLDIHQLGNILYLL